jgi:hypothetical protein
MEDEEEETEPTMESESMVVPPLTQEQANEMLYDLSMYFGCPVMPIAVFEHGVFFCSACFCKVREGKQSSSPQEDA